MKKILLLGSTGIFGKRIAEGLTRKNLPLIIAGRNQYKIIALANQLKTINPNEIYTAIFDVSKDLQRQLEIHKPHLVINTCGPFQNADYNIAETCIKHSVNYIDIADGRDFVNGISSLDKQAKDKHVAVISGASTVPALSSAVIEHFQHDFSCMESMQYGISPGQKAERGIATTQAILSYLGKNLKTFPGAKTKVYGWQDIYRQSYPELGKRWMANCDIPDLDLFPDYYGLKSIQFSAGMENSVLHLGMWLLSWLTRLGLPLNLPAHAETLLKISHWFDKFGSPDGGMHITFRGEDKDEKPLELTWFIIAKNGDGPQIPTIPAIVLANKLMTDELKITGAMPCIGLINLEEYLAELQIYEVKTHLMRNSALV